LDLVNDAAQGAVIARPNEPSVAELDGLGFVGAYQRIFGVMPPFGQALPEDAARKGASVWRGPPLRADLQPRERLLNWLAEQRRYRGIDAEQAFCAYFAKGRLIAARAHRGAT